MDAPWDRPATGFPGLRAAGRRAVEVWRLIPASRRGALAAAAVVIALTSTCQIMIPLALGRLIDHTQAGVSRGLPRSELYRLAALDLAILAGAYLLREAFHVGRRYLIESTCLGIEKETSVRLIGHLMKVELGAFTHEKIGALHGRIGRGVSGFVRFLRLCFLDFLPAILTGLLALAVVLGKQPWLGLVITGVIPASLALTLWQLRSQTGVRLGLLRSREALDGTVVEQLGGLDYIRAADTHEHELARVERAAEQRRTEELRHHFRMSLFGGAKAVNEAFFHLVVLAGAVFFAASGSISCGDVWALSLLFLNVMTPLSEVHRVLDEAHESSLQVDQLLAMLAEPVDPSFAGGPLCPPCLHEDVPAFEVEDLWAEYRTADGKRRGALCGVSLVVAHGETLGVAGRSGGGKTTWLRILLRLTHPCRGRAWLGGVPLESVSRQDIGRLVGYVGQSPFVFAGTVAENIAYGAGPVTREDVEHAARMACLHDEILAMPGGYLARVAERGLNLSGGQRQRIALARVFLKDPPILILDEGTSALDTVSERKIQRAVEAARRRRTVILVAHRLSTLRHADRVAVFEEGRIVEVGGYEELIRRGGAFAELVSCASDATNKDARLCA